MKSKPATIKVLETEFQNNVIELAKRTGWRVHAERPAWTNKGYRTPIQGDAGYPDLTLVRGKRILFLELKSDKGKTSDEQKEWLDMLTKASRDNHYVFVNTYKPSEWELIVKLLQRDDI